MMYGIEYTNIFKKSYKRAIKRGLPINELLDVIHKLANEEKLEEKFRDHALTGNYDGCRECHIRPDWLLIYEKKESIKILVLINTGSHSDFF